MVRLSLPVGEGAKSPPMTRTDVQGVVQRGADGVLDGQCIA